MRQASLQRRRTRLGRRFAPTTFLVAAPRTPLHGQKRSGPTLRRKPQHLAAGSEHLRNIGRYPAHCNRFFTAFVLLRSHPSPAARRRGVVKLWKSSGQSVNGRCIGWATLDVVVGNFCATAWQAVDKLWIKRETLCRRMPPCSADLRLSRGPPAAIRSPTNEKGGTRNAKTRRSACLGGSATLQFAP